MKNLVFFICFTHSSLSHLGHHSHPHDDFQVDQPTDIDEKWKSSRNEFNENYQSLLDSDKRAIAAHCEGKESWWDNLQGFQEERNYDSSMHKCSQSMMDLFNSKKLNSKI